MWWEGQAGKGLRRRATRIQRELLPSGGSPSDKRPDVAWLGAGMVQAAHVIFAAGMQCLGCALSEREGGGCRPSWVEAAVGVCRAYQLCQGAWSHMGGELLKSVQDMIRLAF